MFIFTLYYLKGATEPPDLDTTTYEDYTNEPDPPKQPKPQKAGAGYWKKGEQKAVNLVNLVLLAVKFYSI